MADVPDQSTEKSYSTSSLIAGIVFLIFCVWTVITHEKLYVRIIFGTIAFLMAIGLYDAIRKKLSGIDNSDNK